MEGHWVKDEQNARPENDQTTGKSYLPQTVGTNHKPCVGFYKTECLANSLLQQGFLPHVRIVPYKALVTMVLFAFQGIAFPPLWLDPPS